jgi:hypothetical protein
MRAWTDYPILPEEAGKLAPIREVRVLSYDGDKYREVLVDGFEAPVSIKRGYIYAKPCRLGEAPAILVADKTC